MFMVEPVLIGHVKELYPDAHVAVAEDMTTLDKDVIVTISATAFPFGGGMGVRWLVDFMVFVFKDGQAPDPRTRALMMGRDIITSMDKAVDAGTLGKVATFEPTQLPSLTPNKTASQGHVTVGFMCEMRAHYK